MREISTEPSSIIYEDNINEVLKEQKGEVEKETMEKKFITSPADIEVHKKFESKMLIYQMSNDKLLKTCVWNLMTYFLLILVI